MDSRATLRVDIGFYIGTILWPILNSLYLFGQPVLLTVPHTFVTSGLSLSHPSWNTPPQGPLSYVSMEMVVFLHYCSQSAGIQKWTHIRTLREREIYTYIYIYV